jgi:hypothetical protein
MLLLQKLLKDINHHLRARRWGWFGGSRIREITYGWQKQRKKRLDVVGYCIMGSRPQWKPTIPERVQQTDTS